MSQKRILLFHITNVSGHRQAALAINDALKCCAPDAAVKVINGFNYTNPTSEKIINAVYMHVIRKFPKIWDYLYDNQKVRRFFSGPERFIYNVNCRKLKSLFEEFKPDVIACTQAFPCGMVAAYKRTYKSEVPLVGILTDHAPHSYWFHNEVNYYIVSSEEVREKIVTKGVPEEKIKVLGIPIFKKFAKAQDKSQIRKSFNVDPDLPVALVMGGGQGLGPLEEIILKLSSVDSDFQIIVVSGTNKKIYNWIEAKKNDFKKRIINFGYIDNIDEIMEISTFIITKPGGITISEALAKSLPILVVDPIPGQEESNAEFLTKNKAAINIKDSRHLVGIVRGLLNNREELLALSLNAKAISKPNSAVDIAALLIDLC